MAIKFNNIDIPTFIKVNDIRVSALPPVSQTLLKVNGKAGSYDFGNELGERTIEVAISVIADSPSDLKGKIRTLTEWLYYDDAKEFVILDESDKHYMAKLTGDSGLTEVLHVGQGTIKFICSDPYAYGFEKTYEFNPTSIDEPSIFVNTGGTETHPTMQFEFTADTTSFSIISDDKHMLFGNPLDVTSKTPVSTNPLVLHDSMDKLSGWTSATNIDGGTVTGSFSTNGWSFKVSDYGTNPNAWHGASAIKALPHAVKDFKVQIGCGFLANHPNQLGRIEVYLLDINGKHLGKVALNDTSAVGSYPFAEARAGLLAGGEYFVKSYGNHKGVWKNWSDGRMYISRKGNKWSAYFCIVDKNGKETTRLAKEWIDTKNLYAGNVAQIQIHIGAFKEYAPINTMYISDLKVWEYKSANQDEVPYVFSRGDILEINSDTGMITLNGEPYYESLDPASRFITLKKGVSGITISPLVTTNGIIKFNERWL